jgi:hypothetical protein
LIALCLLVGAAVIATMSCAIWISRAHRQRRLIAAIMQHDPRATISYDNGVTAAADGFGHTRDNSGSWIPSVVEARLGNDYFRTVVAARIGEHLQSPLDPADQDELIENLVQLPALATLSFSTPVRDSDVARIVKLRNLRHLEFVADCAKLTDVSLAKIGRVKSLTSLTLHSAAITDRGLGYLGNARSLTSLTLGRMGNSRIRFGLPQISDAGIAQLGRLWNLKFLWLDCPRMTGAGMAGLAPLQELDYFDWICYRAGDDDLQHLARLEKLHSLHIFGGQFDGHGFVHLAPLTYLENLTLECPNLRDPAFTSIAQLPALKHLVLAYATVSVEGLMALKPAPRLQLLSVSPPPQGDIQQLADTLPACDIYAGRKLISPGH